MYKTNLLLSAFIFSAMFLFACSSSSSPTCNCTDPSSSGVGTPSSSGGSVNTSSSSDGGGSIEDQVLSRKPITISSSKSYADIDGEPVAYTKEDVASNLRKIDLVAYCGTENGFCKNDSIYIPKEIKGGNLFWSPTFIGSEIFLKEIPPDQSSIFITAILYSDIYKTLVSLNSAGYLSGYGVGKVSIKEGKVFFVGTSDDKNCFVIVKAIGNQSVDLEVLLIPTSE
jgi:hypothetical protein